MSLDDCQSSGDLLFFSLTSLFESVLLHILSRRIVSTVVGCQSSRSFPTMTTSFLLARSVVGFVDGASIVVER